MMRMRSTLVLVALLTAAFTLSTAPAASAHNVLESTSPADGSTLEHTPTKVVLTFNNPSIATGTVIEVDGPSGDASAGKPKLVNHKVIQPLKPGSPAGKYTVRWRVTSVDGHPVSGTFHFTSKAPGKGTPSASAGATPVGPAATTQPPRPATEASGSNPWPWVLVVAVVIVAGAVLVATRRRGHER